MLEALASLGVEARADVGGTTPDGTKWKADVLFAAGSRTVAVQLQRGYQPLREFRRRQARFSACGIECFWLFRREPYETLLANLAHTRGAHALPELPVALMEALSVETRGSASVTVTRWLRAVVDGSFRFREGDWRLE